MALVEYTLSARHFSASCYDRPREQHTSFCGSAWSSFRCSGQDVSTCSWVSQCVEDSTGDEPSPVVPMPGQLSFALAKGGKQPKLSFPFEDSQILVRPEQSHVQRLEPNFDEFAFGKCLSAGIADTISLSQKQSGRDFQLMPDFFLEGFEAAAWVPPEDAAPGVCTRPLATFPSITSTEGDDSTASPQFKTTIGVSTVHSDFPDEPTPAPLRRTARGGLLSSLRQQSITSTGCTPRAANVEAGSSRRRLAATSTPIPVPSSHQSVHHQYRRRSCAATQTPSSDDDVAAKGGFVAAALAAGGDAGAPSTGAEDAGTKSSRMLRVLARFYDAMRRSRDNKPPGRPLPPQRVVIGFDV